jgi:hypothetical protein
MTDVKWIGRRQSVGIGRETTRGTKATASYWLNVLSFSFSDIPERALSEASFGNIYGGDQAPLTMIHGEGEMEAELGVNSFGLILYALLGQAPTTTGPTDTVAYTHTYTVDDDSNQHTSLTLITTDPIGQLAYRLAMISSLTINIVPNAIISFTANFLSKGSMDDSGNTASYSSESKFVGRNLSFKLATDTTGLDAATATKLKSLTLTIEKNAEISATLSTLHPEDVVNKQFKISGEVVLDYENRTLFNYITDGSYKAIRIDLTGSSVLTGASTTYPQFRLDLSKVNFENFSPDFSMNEIVTQTLTFNALYDAGGNNNVINACTLINLATSY